MSETTSRSDSAAQMPLAGAPTALILYGATGDLAFRSVIPALFELETLNVFPHDLVIVGNGRGSKSDDEFRARISDSLDASKMTNDATLRERFLKRCHFAGGGFSSDDPGDLLRVLEETVGSERNVVHYFAVPPSAFTPFTQACKTHGLNKFARAVYEKPFGTSLDSFHKLDELVSNVFENDQIFRVDHFVAKEAAQNLIVTRLGNVWLRSIWNREFIECVQIDIPEVLDIVDRAEFYDHTGAFLDMIVTHFFQLVSLIAMDEPVSMSAADIGAARDAALSCMRPLKSDDVVLGQFDGYTNTEKVASDSTTDTFAAVRLFVDSDRWRDVPFLLRTGKRLNKSAQRIRLIMRKPDDAMTHIPDKSSVISYDLAGSGGIEFELAIKQPGAGLKPVAANMRIDLQSVGEKTNTTPMRAYARVIHDCLSDDHTLFSTKAGLESTWKVADDFLNERATKGEQPFVYGPDSTGPEEQSRVLGNMTNWDY